jgi:hypothetical protein
VKLRCRTLARGSPSCSVQVALIQDGRRMHDILPRRDCQTWFVKLPLH